MPKEQNGKRIAFKLRPDLHAIAKQRYREEGIVIQKTVDECLELGMKMKRLLPHEEAEQR